MMKSLTKLMLWLYKIFQVPCNEKLHQAWTVTKPPKNKAWTPTIKVWLIRIITRFRERYAFNEDLSGLNPIICLTWIKCYEYLIHIKFIYIQGVFFNWCSPKINKYGIKFKYQNWCPPKIYKYGEKLKYQNWCPPKHYQFWGNRHGDLHIWRWEHAAGFCQRLLVQGISAIQTFCN